MVRMLEISLGYRATTATAASTVSTNGWEKAPGARALISWRLKMPAMHTTRWRECSMRTQMLWPRRLWREKRKSFTTVSRLPFWTSCAPNCLAPWCRCASTKLRCLAGCWRLPLRSTRRRVRQEISQTVRILIFRGDQRHFLYFKTWALG